MLAEYSLSWGQQGKVVTGGDELEGIPRCLESISTQDGPTVGLI